MPGKEETKEAVETEGDRRTKYRELRAKGMNDPEAREKVWPSSSANIKKNADEKAAVLQKKTAPTGAGGSNREAAGEKKE